MKLKDINETTFMQLDPEVQKQIIDATTSIDGDMISFFIFILLIIIIFAFTVNKLLL